MSKGRKYATSALVINASSRGSRTKSARDWPKRAKRLADICNDQSVSLLAFAELYSAQEKHLTRHLHPRWKKAFNKGGRALFYDSRRWRTTKYSWKRALGTAGTKLTGTDTFYGVGKNAGARLTVSVAHMSHETNAKGQKKRTAETKRLLAWISTFGRATRWRYLPHIVLGDFNSRADNWSGRPDVVGKAMARAGYHDLGLEGGARIGYGRYHMLRGWSPRYVHGFNAYTWPTWATDHAVAKIKFTWRSPV